MGLFNSKIIGKTGQKGGSQDDRKKNPQLRRMPQREKLLGVTPFEKRPGDRSIIFEVAQKQAEILKQISDHQPDLRMSLKKGSVSDMTYWEHEGKRYEVDGHKVVLKYTAKEKQAAEWLAERLNAHVQMVSKVLYPTNIKTPDFLVDGIKYDHKNLTGRGKELLDGAIKNQKTQAERFIIDVTDLPLSDRELKEQLSRIIRHLHRGWVKEITVIRNYKVIDEFKR